MTEAGSGVDAAAGAAASAPAARAAVVVLAGGSGTRVGAATNKVYLPLAGRPVVAWSLLAAAQVAQVRVVVLVVRPQDVRLAEEAVRSAGPADVHLVVGGENRHASEDAAFAHLAPAVDGIDVVAVHDGARPLAGASLFRTVLDTAAAEGGAVPVLPAPGLLPVDSGGEPVRPGVPVGGAALVRVQTPQAFRAADLLAAYRAAGRAGYAGTDTASSVEAFSDLRVRAVPGSRGNLKVTYPRDLALAEHLLSQGGRRPD